MPNENLPPSGSGEDQFGVDQIEVDLRNPLVAAVWAWVWPGAGHLYQRRRAKGFLFMVCILGTFFYGLLLGNGRVVYASWRPGDRHWQYFCQLGVGAPALPALVQSHRVNNGKPPLFDSFMAPPATVHADPDFPDDLSKLHLEYHSYFELGTLYTMIAGLLNVLAIYDAYSGPVITVTREEPEKPPDGPSDP